MLIDTPQMLWGLNSLLLLILAFMIRSWVNGISKKFDTLAGKLGCKQDKTVCAERYPGLKSDIATLYKHKHPTDGEQGTTEGVIIP